MVFSFSSSLPWTFLWRLLVPCIRCQGGYLSVLCSFDPGIRPTMRLTFLTLISLVVASRADGPDFGYETALLTSQDVGDFSDIRPAATDNATTTAGFGTKAACRAFPGTVDWPGDADWKRLNASLGGALLKPVPAGVVCYPGPAYDAAKCTSLVNSQVVAQPLIDDPLGFTTQWPADHPCPITANPTGNCTMKGLPEYVVNVTSVRQIQIAVNFARNRKLRLVIK